MFRLGQQEMNNDKEHPSDANHGGRFHTVQPLRDLESNWSVDLAKNLEEYLLKICSGEITGDDDDEHLSVNFAEAALLLQGSIQVYSRKVEYLYSLVLHALDFISQKSQQHQPENASDQQEEPGSHAVPDEENDMFWGLDDIPVEAKNSLDTATNRDAPLNHFVKPPADLVVLEGDCFDATGDGGELESYLLATNDLYEDFILLDPCDAIAVNDYLKGEKAGKGQNSVCRSSALNSKSRKNFQSQTKRSGGTGRKLSVGKGQDCNLNQSPCVDRGFEFNDCGFTENDKYGFEMDDGYSEPHDLDNSDDDDDHDDPWKPLNPHESGNLKVKPFKKVKASRRNGLNSTKRIPIITQFPLARLHGTISSELTEIWEAKCRASEGQHESQSPPLYEKLRQALVHGGQETGGAFFNPKGDDDDNGYDSGDPGFEPPDYDMPENLYEEVPLQPEKHDDGAIHFDSTEAYGDEDPNSHASLEDLCRSHLDALLATIAEAEKQTEMAARVSTWKQRIEENLEEQDSRPPFDIHEYSEKVLDKLSLEADGGNAMSFADVVKGQAKHDVGRTFSALLQLVNNGNVDLVKDGADGESTCYTSVNPFYVRLLSHEKRHEKVQLRTSRKRVKSPTKKTCIKGHRANSSPSESISTQLNSKLSLKVGKVGGARCTPDGKRRRRSRLVEPVDLHSTR